MEAYKKVALFSHKKFSEELQKSKRTQEEFAEDVGVSDRYIRELKKRDKNISVSLAANISRQFGVSIEDLLINQEIKDD